MKTNKRAFLNSFKTNYMVGVRPLNAKCSHVDNIFVKAFSEQDAMNRVDMAVDHLEYMVKDIIPAGDDIFGLIEPCNCGRDSIENIVNSKLNNFFGITFS